MKKFLPSVLLFILLPTVICAQAVFMINPKEVKGDSIWVWGYVEDDFTREHIIGAEVKVYTEDSAYVTGSMTEDRYKRYKYPKEAFSRPLDYYGIVLPHPGKYILQVSSIDYQTKYVDIIIPKKQYGRKVKVWEPDPVRLKHDIRQLDEISVTASKVMMVMKGDTIVYNASAFQLSEGSMLDQLVRQLPGVELKDGGKIYVHGRFVKNLLINGRDFFSGDASVALQNLPAYTVDKVKVYEKDEDWAYLRNPADTIFSRELPLVMDVRLKRHYNLGWLANGEAAYGTHDRYLLRLFGLRATDHSHLALYANFNNTNDTRVPGATGEWSPYWQPTGEQSLKMGGVDFHVDSRRNKSEYDGSFQATRETNDEETYQSVSTFLPSGDVFSRSHTVNQCGKTHLTLKQNFRLPKKDFFFSVAPKVEFTHQSTEGRLLSAQFSSDPKDSYRGESLDSVFATAGSSKLMSLLINHLQQTSLWEKDSYDAEGRMGLTIKSKLTGNMIRLSADGDWHRQESEDYSRYDLRYTADGDFRNRYIESPSKRHRYQFGFNYEWTLRSFQLNFNYSYEQKFQSDGRSLYRLDRLQEWGQDTTQPFGSLPSATGWEQTAMDLQNSFHTTLHSRYHQPRLLLKAGREQTTGTLTVILPVTVQHDQIADRRNEAAHDVLRRKSFVDPYVWYKRKNFSVIYSMTHVLPEMSYLLDVRDDSNPLSVWRGNSELKVGRKNSGNISYFKRKNKKWWSMDFSGIWLHNAIAQEMNFQPSTGVYTYKPCNVNGNWHVDASANQNYIVGKKGHWSIGSNTKVRYGDNVDMISEDGISSIKSTVHRLSCSENLKADFRIGDIHLGLKGSVDWNHMTSPRINFETINIMDVSYGATLTALLWWKVHLDTDIMMYHRMGYSDRSMNSNDIVWNLSVSRSLDKRNNCLLKFTGFDLLHQLSNVRQSINAQGRTETWYNTVRSYAMVHIIYRMNIKPKKNNKQEIE
jgi:hypothetical protein